MPTATMRPPFACLIHPHLVATGDTEHHSECILCQKASPHGPAGRCRRRRAASHTLRRSPAFSSSRSSARSADPRSARLPCPGSVKQPSDRSTRSVFAFASLNRWEAAACCRTYQEAAAQHPGTRAQQNSPSRSPTSHRGFSPRGSPEITSVPRLWGLAPRIIARRALSPGHAHRQSLNCAALHGLAPRDGFLTPVVDVPFMTIRICLPWLEGCGRRFRLLRHYIAAASCRRVVPAGNWAISSLED